MAVPLPPVPVRRYVLGPALLVLLVLGALALPLLVVVAAVVSAFLPGRWRALRLLLLALVYLALEVVGLVVAAVLWVAAGFGRRLDQPRWQAAHHTVLRRLVVAVVAGARRLFRLEVADHDVCWSPLDDGQPGSERAMVVLARHAGAGDSFLLVRTLMNRDHLRRPRIVLKAALQWDPLVDVYLNRIPSTFVDAGGDEVVRAIGDLAAGMGDEDALLIFPEGGNFTAARRERALASLRAKGWTERAALAEQMTEVLPPRTAGVVAALQAAPHADVVLVAHTGLEHLSTPRDLWRGLPDDKCLLLRWWFHEAADVPREADALSAWLWERWGEVDDWVRAHAGGERRAG